MRSELAKMVQLEIRGAVDAGEHLRSRLTDRTNAGIDTYERALVFVRHMWGMEAAA